MQDSIFSADPFGNSASSSYKELMVLTGIEKKRPKNNQNADSGAN